MEQALRWNWLCESQSNRIVRSREIPTLIQDHTVLLHKSACDLILNQHHYEDPLVRFQDKLPAPGAAQQTPRGYQLTSRLTLKHPTWKHRSRDSMTMAGPLSSGCSQREHGRPRLASLQDMAKPEWGSTRRVAKRLQEVRSPWPTFTSRLHVSEFLQVGTLFKTLRSLRSLDSRPVKFSLLPARFTEND